MESRFSPPTAAADELHAMKYRQRGEDFEESMNRVAFALADDNKHYFAIREIILNQRFLFGGRIQGSAGASRATTAFNCYVSGTIADELGSEESVDAIMDRLKEAAITSKLGGGIGYDFSTLRPRGDLVRKIQSTSTGPISFMQYFNSVCLGVASAGHRRGAQMAVLRVDHPDIEEFISCKQWTNGQNAIWAATENLPASAREQVFLALQEFNPLQGFNVSVGVTDEFMEAVYADHLFPLRFDGRVYKDVRAADLWQRIMRSAWDWAEPGVLFLDTINRMNNLSYCEKIAATNPCGEQPLPPYGACLLGSWNLTKFLKKQFGLPRDGGSGLPSYEFDFDQLAEDTLPIVTALDNVNDRTLFPITLQKQDAQNKRRMGIGVTGLANTIEACGHPYGSPGAVALTERILETIRDAAYRASIEVAKTKGAFPYLTKELYLQSKFVETLPADIYAGIQQHGIRNSHLTSIAPTGTISLCAGNVSGGIEPVFAYETRRKVNTPTGPVEARLGDYGVDFLGVRGKQSADVTPQEHVAMLVTAQKYVDSAVTKTCNTTGATPWDEFLGIYETVYRGGGKGCTVFNRDGKRGSLLTAGLASTTDDGPSCAIDSEGRKSCE